MSNDNGDTGTGFLAAAAARAEAAGAANTGVGAATMPPSKGATSGPSKDDNYRPMPWVIPAGIAAMLVVAGVVADRCDDNNDIQPNADETPVYTLIPFPPSEKPLTDYERGYAKGLALNADKVCAPAARFENIHPVVYFAPDSYVLSDDSRRLLDMVGCIAENYLDADGKFDDGGRLVLAGGTSSDGREASNMNLSWQRAQAVGMYLRHNGAFGNADIEFIGYGENPEHRVHLLDDPEDTAVHNRSVIAALEFDR